MVVLAIAARSGQRIVVFDQVANLADRGGHRTLADAARTLPGSVSRTVTSREPHFGQRMRLESIEIGKALPRVHSMVRTSSSCCSPQERTDFSRRGAAWRSARRGDRRPARRCQGSRYP